MKMNESIFIWNINAVNNLIVASKNALFPSFKMGIMPFSHVMIIFLSMKIKFTANDQA